MTPKLCQTTTSVSATLRSCSGQSMELRINGGLGYGFSRMHISRSWKHISKGIDDKVKRKIGLETRINTKVRFDVCLHAFVYT